MEGKSGAKSSDSQDGMGERIPQLAKSYPTNRSEVDTEVRKDVEHASRGAHTVDVDTAGEVNMEAAITPEEVVRAGGFGARDDVSSVLPVASDSTDFEASLLVPVTMKNHKRKYPDQVLAGAKVQIRSYNLRVAGYICHALVIQQAVLVVLSISFREI